MKKLIIYFCLLIFGYVNAQKSTTFQKLILNGKQDYIGKIDDDADIKVSIDSAIVEQSNPENYRVFGKTNVKGTICDFEGTIKLNKSDTEKLGNQSMKFYTFSFQEKKTHDHTGELSGALSIKQMTNAISVFVFEGVWKSYNQKMKFPVYFDNFENVKRQLSKLNN